jgi:ATP-dependent Zn protease
LNEERDQTLNQMLVEMDGFNKPGGVLVLAATNRAEALDPALLRPGRLTRRVFVGPPDFKGRCQIMRVHLRGVATDTSLDLTVETVAKLTPGFTGAELANVVNEACLLAARDDREVVTLDDFAKGAERTKNGVGVGKGAASVLSRLRELVTRNDGWGGEGGGSDDGNGGRNGGGGGSNREGGAAHKVPEGNKKQGVGLSMPPT